MNQLLKVFKSIRKLSPDLYGQLAQHAEYQSLKKGDLIKTVGEGCDTLYFIETGVVRGYMYKQESQETFWFKKENDFILQLELVVGKGKTNKELEIQMLEDGRLWMLSGSVVSRFVKEFTEFNFHLMHLIMKEAIMVRETVLLERRGDPSLKYDYLRQHAPDLLRRVDPRYLASFVGVTEKEFLHLHKSELHLPMSGVRRRRRKK